MHQDTKMRPQLRVRQVGEQIGTELYLAFRNPIGSRGDTVSL
jgi:hypothetical protein